AGLQGPLADPTDNYNAAAARLAGSDRRRSRHRGQSFESLGPTAARSRSQQPKPSAHPQHGVGTSVLAGSSSYQSHIKPPASAALPPLRGQTCGLIRNECTAKQICITTRRSVNPPEPDGTV